MPEARQSLRLALARDHGVKVKFAPAILSATLSVPRMRWLECPLISARVVRVPARTSHGAHLNFKAIRFRMPQALYFTILSAGGAFFGPASRQHSVGPDDATGI